VVDPPALPKRLSDVVTVIGLGAVVWALAAVVLLVLALTGVRPLDVWFTTCLVGVGLGAVGFGIFSWQRAAARRGSRTAQQGLDD
jgi:drug/metabolite transporter (DMT)-like permease